ncbi:MAG TPA: helix-turn-helix transcriptional regulator [Romboutsia timonensis]|uniref:Helix-turn-helix transcriptional regulator n=1 Tax=Romboutsia timonensis TaxID=1776391 RepID=A0A921SYL1_9FIRM|nr:helix-turn-helix transcriptional regulator [uncultured Romboutsia sp.]HJG95547.1 helix-turn-helix transcriptional regulator [Romboutsia timonensis]
MNILSLGEKIKKLRKEKNMTLKELAGDRITAAQISHIERDKSHTSSELLEYLAKQLDVSVDYLLETKEMQSKKLTDNLILQSEILIKCNNLEKAEEQLNEAIKICYKYNVLDNYGTCNFLLADINFKNGKYSEAVMSYEKALHYFIRNNDKEKLYKCYLNIGKIYLIEELYKGAIFQFEFAEGILNEIKIEDVDTYKDLYSKMAYCYIKLNNNEKSLYYINKMDEIDIKNNPDEELNAIMLKANNLLNMGEFEKSKEYFKKALEILDEEKNKTELASIYLTISEIYKSIGNLDKVLEYSQRVYDIKKSDEDEYMMKSLFKIIEVYISNYDYDMAKRYCKIALASSIKNKNRLNEYKILKYYSDMYKAQNENVIAIEYLHKCISIISELNNKKILADLYINLGELYSNISKDKELEYYQKGVCIYKNIDII